MRLFDNYRVALAIIRQHKPCVGYEDNLQKIVDEFEIESVRICEQCGKPHIEGYIVGDCENYCSIRCLRKAGIYEDYYWTDYL